MIFVSQHKRSWQHLTLEGKGESVKQRIVLALGVIGVLLLILAMGHPLPVAASGGGFDQFGYNYAAMIFVGNADGVDRTLDGMVWGDPTYANDHLVMKWNKAWDDARFNGAPWTCAAWVDNEWNGRLPSGTGWTEHTKIIYVGPALSASNCWHEGGFPIWGSFEILMDQGLDPSTNSHVWYTLANSPGYGMTK